MGFGVLVYSALVMARIVLIPVLPLLNKTLFLTQIINYATNTTCLNSMYALLPKTRVLY